MYLFLKKLSPKWIFGVMCVLSIGGSILGMILEKYFDFQGCILCHMERWILLIGGGCAFLTAIWWPLAFTYLTGIGTAVLFFVGMWVCFYHAGIQYHFFKEPSFCKVRHSESLDDFLQLKVTSPPCSQKTLSIFSIPASIYLSASFCLGMIICLYALRKKNAYEQKQVKL